MQVQAMVNQAMATNVPLPYVHSVTTEVMTALNAVATSPDTTAEQKFGALIIGSNLMALKAELGGDLTYADFAQTTKQVVARTVKHGDTYAKRMGWTNVVTEVYIRGLYR
jgi:hypothetical protein